MPRETISAAQRKAEGKRLGQLIDAMQRKEPGLTQESLAAEMSVSQGLIGQWKKGITPIPDKRLLWLGNRLGFDPAEFRPGVSRLQSEPMISVSPRLSEVIRRIPKGQEDRIADILGPILEALK